MTAVSALRPTSPCTSGPALTRPGRAPPRPVPDQLGTGGDAELHEDLAQVVLDGAGAEEELRRDVLVGGAFTDEPSNLELLRRQLIDRARGRGGVRFRPSRGARRGARSAHGAAPRRSNPSSALRSCSRASRRRRSRRRCSPYSSRMWARSNGRLTSVSRTRLVVVLSRLVSAHHESATARESRLSRWSGVRRPGLERRQRLDRLLRAPEPNERLHSIRDGQDRCEGVSKAGTHVRAGRRSVRAPAPTFRVRGRRSASAQTANADGSARPRSRANPKTSSASSRASSSRPRAAATMASTPRGNPVRFSAPVSRPSANRLGGVRCGFGEAVFDKQIGGARGERMRNECDLATLPGERCGPTGQDSRSLEISHERCGGRRPEHSLRVVSVFTQQRRPL